MVVVSSELVALFRTPSTQFVEGALNSLSGPLSACVAVGVVSSGLRGMKEESWNPPRFIWDPYLIRDIYHCHPDQPSGSLGVDL